DSGPGGSRPGDSQASGPQAAGGDALARDPALAVCGCHSRTGLYCASGVVAYASQNHRTVDLTAGNQYNLLRCKDNGTWTVEQVCTFGCDVAPQGTNDACHLPTCGCYAGNGAYCGAGVKSWAAQNSCQVSLVDRKSTRLNSSH